MNQNGDTSFHLLLMHGNYTSIIQHIRKTQVTFTIFFNDWMSNSNPFLFGFKTVQILVMGISIVPFVEMRRPYITGMAVNEVPSFR